MDIDVSSLAKLLADRYGHGMSEKCETQAEVILEVVGERVKELEAENQELKNYIGYHLSGEQKECIKELEAHCERLRSVIEPNKSMHAGSVLEETPTQSLAHIQREAIETAHKIVMASHGIDVEALTQYAEQLTKGSKE